MCDIERAIIRAVNVHHGQLDKRGKPYILHPLTVMLATGDDNDDLLDERLKILAVLHDVPEESRDPDEQIRMLCREFGSWLEVPLTLLTHADNRPYREYIMNLMGNSLAVSVKINDILHNLSRMIGLPQSEVDRLRAKYKMALDLLMA